MFIEKDKDKMSYEDKVMVLDKCASINPGVAYKYRFNIIQENQLRLIGDDIIFSVPKIKSIKLPEIADINNKKQHDFVADVLTNTKINKTRVVDEMNHRRMKVEMKKKKDIIVEKVLKDLEHFDKIKGRRKVKLG